MLPPLYSFCASWLYIGANIEARDDCGTRYLAKNGRVPAPRPKFGLDWWPDRSGSLPFVHLSGRHNATGLRSGPGAREDHRSDRLERGADVPHQVVSLGRLLSLASLGMGSSNPRNHSGWRTGGPCSVTGSERSDVDSIQICGRIPRPLPTCKSSRGAGWGGTVMGIHLQVC